MNGTYRFAGDQNLVIRFLLLFCQAYAFRSNGKILVYKILAGRRYLVDVYRPRGK